MDRPPKRPPQKRERKPVTTTYKAEINPSWEWKGDARELGVSHRELEVLALLIEGHTNKEVAEILHIEYQSVKNHMYRLMQKLGVKNGRQAVVIALSMNLLKWTMRVGRFSVDVNSDAFLEEFKKLLDGRVWTEGNTEKGRRAVKDKLLSHGIYVDKAEDGRKSEKNEQRSYRARPLCE